MSPAAVLRALLLAACLVAPPSPAVADPAARTLDVEAFDQVKSLAGRWEGRLENAEGRPATIEYEITANGRAVLERLFAGTDHEMVTMYYLAYDRLQATHYCAMGNQPAYRLASGSTARNIIMEAAGGTGFDPSKDNRANGERLELVAPDQLRVEVQFRTGTEPPTSASMLLTRVPAPPEAPAVKAQ